MAGPGCKLDETQQRYHDDIVWSAFRGRNREPALNGLRTEALVNKVPACAVTESLTRNTNAGSLLDRDTVAGVLAQGVVAALYETDRARAKELMALLWKNMPTEGVALYIAKSAEYLYLASSSDAAEIKASKEKVPQLMFAIESAREQLEKSGSIYHDELPYLEYSRMIPKNFAVRPEYAQILKQERSFSYGPLTNATAGSSPIQISHLVQGHLLQDLMENPVHVAQVGGAQHFLLRRLESLAPVMILDENPKGELPSQVKAIVRRAFAKIPAQTDQLTSEQRGILASVGAGRIYAVLHPQTKLFYSGTFAEPVLQVNFVAAMINNGGNANFEPTRREEMQKRSESLYQLVEDRFRQLATMERLNAAVKGLDSGKVAVIFGGAHDFTSSYQEAALQDKYGHKIKVVLEGMKGI